MNPWLVNAFLLFALSISTLGDVFAKTWTFNKRPSFVVIALVLYTIASSLWIFWLQFNKLAVALAWWQAFGAILTLSVATFYFKEKITWVEGLAIGLVISGLVVLNAHQFLKSAT